MPSRTPLLLAVLFSASSALVVAGPPSRAEADRLFANGDFKAAAAAYRALLDASSPASALSASSEVVSPGAGVLEPSITLPQAISPVGKGGTSVLLALVSEKGAVLDLRVVSSAGKEVDAAAVEALRTAQITPATRAGQPVRMWVTKAVSIPAAL